MNESRRHLIASACLLVGGLFLGGTVASAQDISPNEWLNRMASAVKTSNYEGTVIRLQNGKIEALKVVHVVTDGVIHEKVVIQEGNGLEIIRNGNEVHCILPDQKSVLVEEWNDQSTLFSTLPSGDIRFGNEYDVSIVRQERVAGRKAVMLAIRPHDDFRFGYRIWLDVATGFPLQTTLLGDDGDAIEEVKFADISLNRAIDASALAPSISTESFRWFTQPQRSIVPDVDSTWSSDDIPPGFRIVSAQRESTVTHILYSDGLANVSVFIEPAKEEKIARRSRVGATNSFSIEIDGNQITAVGEVPAATVEQIAMSMRSN